MKDVISRWELQLVKNTKCVARTAVKEHAGSEQCLVLVETLVPKRCVKHSYKNREVSQNHTGKEFTHSSAVSKGASGFR